MMSINLLLMDYTTANRHRTAIEHMYQTNFVSMHNANVWNKPSIDMVCYDKWHDLYMYPMYHDSHGWLNIAVGLPDFVPLLQ